MFKSYILTGLFMCSMLQAHDHSSLSGIYKRNLSHRGSYICTQESIAPGYYGHIISDYDIVVDGDLYARSIKAPNVHVRGNLYVIDEYQPSNKRDTLIKVERNLNVDGECIAAGTIVAPSIHAKTLTTTKTYTKEAANSPSASIFADNIEASRISSYGSICATNTIKASFIEANLHIKATQIVGSDEPEPYIKTGTSLTVSRIDSGISFINTGTEIRCDAIAHTKEIHAGTSISGRKATSCIQSDVITSGTSMSLYRAEARKIRSGTNISIDYIYGTAEHDSQVAAGTSIRAHTIASMNVKSGTSIHAKTIHSSGSIKAGTNINADELIARSIKAGTGVNAAIIVTGKNNTIKNNTVEYSKDIFQNTHDRITSEKENYMPAVSRISDISCTDPSYIMNQLQSHTHHESLWSFIKHLLRSLF